jgi:hypothetical protein
MIRMALHLSSYDLRAFLRNRQSQFFSAALSSAQNAEQPSRQIEPGRRRRL